MMPTDISSKTENTLIQYAVIFVLGFLIYSNVLQGEFVSDDYMWIVDNPSIRQPSLHGIWQEFNTRFIVGLSFALNYRLGGLNPFGYHLFNIFAHIINAFLVYHFVLRIFQTPILKKSSFQEHFPSIAFYASLIFLSHPMQTEGVSYICQRFVSLSTMFYLGTLISYMKARLDGKVVFYGVAVVLMAMGLFTKEMTFTLPFSVIIIELLFFGSTWKVHSKRFLSILLGGMALVAVPLLTAHGRFEERFLIGAPALEAQAFWIPFFAELNVLRRYLTHFVFPSAQSHSYDYPMAEGLGGIPTILSVILLITLIAYAFRKVQKERVLSYAIIWFFITTSVEAAFAVIYADQHNSFMFDHWAYLSMVGFSIFLATVVCRLCRDVRWGRAVLMVIVLLFSMLTYERNKVWQTEIGLWEDVLRKNPKTLVHYLALGVSYDRKGRWEDAALVYGKAIKMYEQGALTDTSSTVQNMYVSRIYNNWGIIAADNEHNERRAAEFFHRATQFDKSNSTAYNNLRLIEPSVDLPDLSRR